MALKILFSDSKSIAFLQFVQKRNKILKKLFHKKVLKLNFAYFMFCKHFREMHS